MLLARRIIASIIAILTIPVFITLVFFSNLAKHFSDPNFYNKHLIEANVYEHISGKIILDIVEQSDIPNDELYSDLSSALLNAFDAEWMQTNIEHSLSELIPYFSGDKNHFNIEISLKDRTEVVLVGLNTKLKQPKYYDLFTTNILLPILYEETKSTITDNIGVELSENELNELVVSSITQTDYEDLLDTAFDSMTPYILGEQDTFSIGIQMQGKWDQSLSNLALLADKKLTTIFYETPKCCCEELALEQLKDVDTSNAKFLFDGSIFCFPPDLEYEDAKSLMSIRIENMLTDSLIEQMPQYITLTSNDMQENQKEVLNLVREYSTLKIILDDKKFVESAFQNDEDSIQRFDSIRQSISNTPNPRTIIWIFAITALLTSLIGGRIWIGAIQWTAIITAIASTLIILGVMIIRMASHEFETLITNSLGEIITDSNGSTDIILQVFNNVVGQLTTSIQSQFQIPLIVSLLVLLVTIIYSFMNKRAKA